MLCLTRHQRLVAKILVNELICRFGTISQIYSEADVTNETSNRLVLGREVATAVTLLVGWPNTAQAMPWVTDLRRKFEDTHRLVV